MIKNVTMKKIILIKVIVNAKKSNIWAMGFVMKSVIMKKINETMETVLY